jgi:hypothetical protein
MSTFAYPLAAQEAQAALIAAPYNAGVIHLLKAPVTLGPNLLLADCTAQEADFTGYAAVVLPAHNPIPFPDGARGGVSFNLPTSNFTVGATPTGNDIYGMYAVTASGALLWALLFANQQPMQLAGQQLNLEENVNLFGTGQVNVTINGTPG